jgi:glycine/sarcosine N-methyltransferase
MLFKVPGIVQQDSHNDTNPFYDAIADYYHLFYRDWRAALERDGSALRRMFRNRDIRTVLDASCGPGTQAIALAMHQFEVTAADPSRRMIQKARENAREFEVADDITFVQAGFLELSRVLNGPYDAVITKGNSLPHLLSDEEIFCALQNFFALLRPGGLLVIGIRDFDMLLEDRPRFVPRQAHLDDPERDHILFDVWDWHEGPPVTVTFNTFLVSGKGDDYAAVRYPVTYRALRRAELWAMLERIGFIDIQVEDQNWEQVFTATKPD